MQIELEILKRFLHIHNAETGVSDQETGQSQNGLLQAGIRTGITVQVETEHEDPDSDGKRVPIVIVQ